LNRALFRFVAVFIALQAALPLRADDSIAPLPATARQITQAFDAADWPRAAELCDSALAVSPNHPWLLYNAACARARLGETERSADFLFRAVQAGFADFDHMEKDADLEPIRTHAVYERIVEARGIAFERAAAAQLQRAREMFGEEGYRYESDVERRINYATALDDVSHAEMRGMVERQYDYLVNELFDAPPTYFCLIAVPTPERAGRMIRNPLIGGIYEHTHRRLIARDIGAMLRHELVHLVHFGHMERLGQMHPLWIHEGISTLFENYEVNEDGTFRFLPNQRFNTVKRMVDSSVGPRWEQLFNMTREDFMSRSGQTYPLVRSIFRFLAERGKLGAWYRALIETFDEDPTGIKAFEAVFEEELAKTERRWRNWVKGQPEVEEFVMRGDASLGIAAEEDGANDGVLIDAVLHRSAAQRAGIQPGDVIVSIDGEATRSMRELLAVIAPRAVGDVVVVRLRRGGEYLEVTATLQPLSLSLRPETAAPPDGAGLKRAAA
jgi:hypothetical protein